MSGPGWTHPEWAGAAAASIVAMAAVIALGTALARWRLERLLGRPRTGERGRLARDVALLAAFAALVVGALGPVVGERTVWVEASGVDAVILVDVSRSMEAADVPPSRLARARGLADRLLAGLHPGDRAALAAFAGRGVLLTPLTPDHGALRDMLPALDPELMAERGSWLGAGVRAAIAAFPGAGDRPRVLVVLSDGEAPALADDTGAADARRAGVRVVSVALGTEQGAVVPDSGVPLRDRRGDVVISRRDARRLARLAEATGGALLEADRFGEVPEATLLREVRRDAGQVPGEPVARRVPAPRTLWLALLAFVLLAAEAARGAGGRGSGAEGAGPHAAARQGRRARAVRRAACLLPAALALALPAGTSRAQDALPPELRPPASSERTETPGARALLRAGVVRARRGDLDGAARALRGAALTARDEDLAALAYFDLGVAELERGRLERARDAFLDALALAPGDEQARFNLEWTLQAMQEQGREPETERSEDDASRPDPEAGDPGTEPDRPLPEAEDDARAGEQGRPRAEQTPAELPQLSPEEVQRWLDAVQDDPARGLRRAARRGGSERRVRGPAW